jgi:hypothetical protein
VPDDDAAPPEPAASETEDSQTPFGPLIAQVSRLDEQAAALQANRAAPPNPAACAALVRDYHQWYSDAQAVLEGEARTQFIAEYEGNWYSNKIKGFLAQPQAVGVPTAPEGLFGDMYWTIPYGKCFKTPLLEQRRILVEAELDYRRQKVPNAVIRLTMVLGERIGLLARQLRHRHDNRPTIEVSDEYDLQDLFHAVLLLHFDDVRAEEWTPSYAGGSARMDFLLKAEQIVVELKMTRAGLADKEVRDQLAIDLLRYRAHKDCRELVVVVYDPDRRIRNPAGLVSDLSVSDGRPRVHVVIGT